MTIEEPEDGKSYGIAAVVKWLDEESLEFPMSKSKINSELGGRNLILAHDEIVKFSKILDEVEGGKYENLEDFLSSLGEGFRAVDSRAKRYI